MAHEQPQYARVIVDVAPAHLDRPFDYRVPAGTPLQPGQRVRVDFAGRRRAGWVVAVTTQPSTDPERIRELRAVDGAVVWFDDADLRLYRWVARRYAATLADVLRHALPPRVAAVEREAAQIAAPPPRPVPAARPPCALPAWRPYAASALLRATAAADVAAPAPAFYLRALPGDDPAELVADLVARCLSAGRSALVLAADRASVVPEAALRVAGSDGADLRTDADRERYRAFLRLRDGRARVAAGERSAALLPLADLGLVVVDDEANPAHKERRSPRHNAREVALARARMAGATCVLLGDLPSAAAWRLLQAGHLQRVEVDRAEERHRAPRVEVVDLSDPRPGTRRARLAEATTRRLSATVAAGGAAVVLATRGGQGAAHVCRGCGRRATCPVCETSLRPTSAAAADGADGAGGWRCPACEWDTSDPACPDCGATATAPLAAGAGRLAQELARSYPHAEVLRMEGFDAPGPRGRPAIAVMTRGSVVARPEWLRGERAGADLVVVPDADGMLRRSELDAAEDALRLWLAVARWLRPGGRLVLQTREPADPAVQALVRWDPDGWWEREAPRRAELRWPPARSLVRLAARDGAEEVASALRAVLPPDDELLGPTLEGVLLVKSADLRGTLDAISDLRHAWAKADRGVRIEVDPV